MGPLKRPTAGLLAREARDGWNRCTWLRRHRHTRALTLVIAVASPFAEGSPCLTVLDSLATGDATWRRRRQRNGCRGCHLCGGTGGVCVCHRRHPNLRKALQRWGASVVHILARKLKPTGWEAETARPNSRSTPAAHRRCKHKTLPNAISRSHSMNVGNSRVEGYFTGRDRQLPRGSDVTAIAQKRAPGVDRSWSVPPSAFPHTSHPARPPERIDVTDVTRDFLGSCHLSSGPPCSPPSPSLMRWRSLSRRR
jgi:hypothetical protein